MGKPSSIYANNFGATEHNRVNSQETTVNIESVIIDLILKPLVNRLIDMQEEIMNQENLVSRCIISFKQFEYLLTS